MPASFLHRALRSSALAALASVTLLLAACASTSTVTSTSQPDVYTVTSAASMAPLAWANAHAKAASEATGYCARLGMRESTRSEALVGGAPYQKIQLQFECHRTL
ncbi:hypothetical protein [Burkholderia guangdongensis]|uniref:hypothetical protein n=1 Tax=Burkholderia guangdongensis TaxID=1792500 RepID=UPI0015CB256B|nr:hypothetical protein [Burkholderia guangdongensis]